MLPQGGDDEVGSPDRLGLVLILCVVEHEAGVVVDGQRLAV